MGQAAPPAEGASGCLPAPTPTLISFLLLPATLRQLAALICYHTLPSNSSVHGWSVQGARGSSGRRAQAYGRRTSGGWRAGRVCRGPGS